MAKQTVNLGTVANDGTGDTLRDGGDKINDNFDELYAADYMPKAGGTFSGDIVVPAEAYAPGWNGSNEAPTKNDVYDKIESVVAGGATVSDTAYGVGWNGDTTTAPSKNAVYDKIEAVVAGSGTGTVTSVATAGLATGGPITGTGTVTVTAAVASDINTGTDTTKALTADALAGSNFGKEVVTILVSDPAGSAITTGDGKAYWRVPSVCNGMNLVAVAAALTTVSSSGIPTIQIANVTQAADMLTTKLTIDASETDSSTAAAAAVIDTGNDDVATGDMLRIDIDVAGTGAKGLMVEMQFQLP